MEKFYNSPCALWKGYLLEEKREQIKENIVDYVMAAKFDICGDMAMVRNELNIINGDNEKILSNGHKLIKRWRGTAQFSVDIATFWDFYCNYHSDAERVTFLAYIALKSIIGKKEYTKTNATMWLSRMDGNTKPIDKSQLSAPIKEWATPYKIRKLKAILWKYYHVGFYSANVHGFYASIKLTSRKLAMAIKKDDGKRENLVEEYKTYHKAAALVPNEAVRIRDQNTGEMTPLPF